MKPWIIAAALVWLLFGGPAAQAQSCNIIISSLSATNPYDPFGASNNDTQGSFSFSCTRPKGNPRFPSNFFVGVSGTNGARSLASGANTLGYELHTNFSGCSTPWQTTSGILIPNTLTSNTDLNAGPFSGTYCFRMPAGQNTTVPGSYSDIVTITVYSDTTAGFVWAQTTFSLSALVNASCSFTSATNVSVPYTSFTASAQTGNSPFQLRCTNTTPYGLALDVTSASLLGLNYTLALSASSGTGSGVAQSYSTTVNVPANQSGTCNAATCTATRTHTLTLTY
jgi:spore coat protein U-like protein